jgi:DNA-binding NarL/FixJ family response regulator
MKLIIYGSELLFSEALSAILVRRGHDVVGRALLPGDLVPLAESTTVDACLVDVSAPVDVAAVRNIKRALPALPVVVLSGEHDRALLADALEAGIDGICLKTDDVAEIERVLIQTGSAPHSSPVWSSGANASSRRISMPRGTRLTPKERAVLDLLILGTSTAGISAALGVSEATVRTHLQHLFGKFGVHSRIALIAAAVHANGSRVDDTMLALR